jgi:gas vesicle protein
MANRIVNGESIRNIVKQADLISFHPNPAQKKFKIKYYNKAELLGVASPELAELGEIQELAGMDPDTLASWWTPVFENWFRDRQHITDRIDYLFESAIERAAELMAGADRDSDSLAAMKFLKEVRSEIKAAQKEEKANDQVDKEQLEKLIEQLGYVKKIEGPSE